MGCCWFNIIITINGKKKKKIMLYAFENVEKYDYRFVLKKIMKKFFLFFTYEFICGIFIAKMYLKTYSEKNSSKLEMEEL